VRVLAHSGAALAALLGAPVALVGLVVRPAWREGWRERLGAAPRLEPGAVWVHGASVGESLAALPLHDALRARGFATLASTTTVTGRAVLRQRRGELPVALAPLDHPWCTARALDRARPRALVLVETELWPSLTAAAARRGVPVVAVSARLSDRSFPRYRRLAFALRPTLRRLAAVGARSREDAERFVELGVPAARVEVTGDLKLEPPREPAPLAGDLAAFLADRPLFVAGSTHPGEEAAALAALAALEVAEPGAALALAPRHPDRFDAVERQVRDAGRRLHRRSRLAVGARLGAGEVLLLDTLGELAAVYRLARVAFVGGSLAPVGGHNVLEPVAAGAPVLFGPHTENARAGVELVLAADAGRRVADASELARDLVAAWGPREVLRARAERGRTELERHRGASQRSADLVLRVLGERG
jgi:3-deoxy-D-manno-octulosonic-acid transferase